MALADLHSACISGAIPQADHVAGWRAPGLLDVEVRDRLVHDRAQLHAPLDSDFPGSCRCGPPALPAAELERSREELAGRVASIRVVGCKPEGTTARTGPPPLRRSLGPHPDRRGARWNDGHAGMAGREPGCTRPAGAV